MVNEILNKVSNLDYSRKAYNKDSDREAPAKSELKNRSDLRHADTIAISGQQPVEIQTEKVIEPVSGQDNNMQLISDESHKEAIANGSLFPNVRGTEKGNEDIKITPKSVEVKPAVDQTNDPMKVSLAKEESSSVDLLTAAYGKKETEVGKVIRMTV